MTPIAPGRDGLYVHVAPAHTPGAAYTKSLFGWSVSKTFFGREVVVGWLWRRDVALHVEDDEE